MKASLQWIKDYVPISVSVETLMHRFTMAGLEVEKVRRDKGDTVFELEITPNRPDCLSMIGLAREAAAILNKPLTLPVFRKTTLPRKKCSVEIQDREGCLRYIGTVIEHVAVGASPDWLQERLSSVGVRTINNIVDITNFCLMETGQPLHAFDYDKLVGGGIIVRRARKGEKLVTIDGVERELDPSIIVIADTKRPVAIAGIMGGLETEVTAGTKKILLESAYFSPMLIRRASRRLGLSSDSSYRFERGVDMQMVEGGARRAQALIAQLAQGKAAQHSDVFLQNKKQLSREIKISIAQIQALLGAPTTTAKCRHILKKLGFGVKAAGQTLKIVPPTFRTDISREVDIVEEIGRIVGYDHLPSSLPVIKASHVPEDVSLRQKKIVRQAMSAQGYSEVVTYTMLNASDLDKAKQPSSQGIRIKNPLTQDQQMLRSIMLPSLLSVVRANFNRGQKDLKIFEIGKTYSSSGETDVLAILATGVRREDWRETSRHAVDFFDIKGACQAVSQKLKLGDLLFLPTEETIFESGECAKIFLGKKEVGHAGKICNDILAPWDIKYGDVLWASMNGSILFEGGPIIKKYAASSEFPAVVRDVSLSVDKGTKFQQIKDIALENGAPFLTDIRFVEQYLGDKIPSGKKGLVFSLTYQALDRTLTEEETSSIHSRVCQAIISRTEAGLR